MSEIEEIASELAHDIPYGSLIYVTLRQPMCIDKHMTDKVTCVFKEYHGIDDSPFKGRIEVSSRLGSDVYIEVSRIAAYRILKSE